MNKKLLFFSILFSLLFHIAFAQDEYVKPGQIVEKNKAPGMRIKLLSTTGKVKTYAIILNRGDDILSGLTQFAEDNHVTCAHFTGIGAVSSARLGCYDREKQMYHIIPVKGQAETISFIGNVAIFNGKPVVHVHMAVSQSDGAIRGGHLFQAYVWPTLEIVITVEPTSLYKKKEMDTGFALIDPGLNE
jgi:predicted DNA-binding protein with PD1-like motif